VDQNNLFQVASKLLEYYENYPMPDPAEELPELNYIIPRLRFVLIQLEDRRRHLNEGECRNINTSYDYPTFVGDLIGG